MIYQDSGSHRAFVLASGVKVTLVSGDGVRSASGTLPELESLLEDAFGGTSAAAHPVPSGIGLGSHYFELTLGTGGQITGIESLYHP